MKKIMCLYKIWKEDNFDLGWFIGAKDQERLFIDERGEDGNFHKFIYNIVKKVVKEVDKYYQQEMKLNI